LAIIEHIKQSTQKAPHKKLYLSRTKYKTNPVFGELEIERAFRKNGYKIIHPEQISIQKQIAYMKGAKVVAGVVGSQMHNAIFCEKGTRIININRLDMVPSNQLAIEKSFGLDSVYVDAYLDILPNNIGMGPFLLGPNEFLLKFFRDMGFSFYESKFRKPLRKNLHKFIEKWGIVYSNDKTYYWIKQNKFSLSSFAKKLNELLGGDQ
jgi:hypothetical protein